MSTIAATNVRICPYCIGNGEDFRAPSDVLLFRHVRLVHACDPGFSIQCSFDGCSRTFKHFRTYQNHILLHNSVRVHRARDEDELEPSYDSDDDSEHCNESSYIPSAEDMQSFAAKWILKTSETRSLTRAATLGIVEDVSTLADFISSCLKEKICDILKTTTIDSSLMAEIDSAFSCPITKPFSGLTTFHHQIQYYKKYFGLIVSIKY